MKKRSYLAMCLVMAMLCACLVTVPAVMVGAEASPFDIDFDDMSAGALDTSGESNAIQYWTVNNIGSANPQVVAENGNNFLRIDGTNETQASLSAYVINWSEDLSQDQYSETSFRFRMSDMSRSEDTAMKPYFTVGFGYKNLATNDGHKFPGIFAVSDDGKSILAMNEGNITYQNGTQVNYYQPLYTSETSLADMWLDVKIKLNFSTGALACTIADENGTILTSFVQKFGTTLSEKMLYSIHLGMNLNVNDTTYRRMKIDLDEISYKGYTQVPNPFDIDFEDMLAGAFDSSGESSAIQYWTDRNLGSLTKTVETENGNNYLKIHDFTALTPFYVISTDQVANYTKDQYVESSFRFRMSEIQQGTDPNENYFYLNVGNYKSDGTNRTEGVLTITADGKKVYPRDVNGCMYHDGEKVNNAQALYTSETSLENQWLTLKTINNYDSGQVKIFLYGENGDLLTDAVLKLGSAFQGGSMLNIIPFAMNMTLDIDDVVYKGQAAPPAEESLSIDFENSALGTFDYSCEPNAIRYWSGRNLAGVTQTVKEESGNRYLKLDLTDEAIQSTFNFYPVNWLADISQDKYSESTFRFRMSDLTKSVDETGYPYLAATISYADGTTQPSHGVFAISEDGKSIVAYDWSARIYQNGVQKNRLDSLYEAETSLADQWITLKMANNFETGELTCRFYGEDGKLLTRFVQKFDTAMKGRYLYNICFGLYTYYNGVYRRMNLDLDDIAYEAYTEAPAAATYDVTVSYDENKGTVSCDGTAVSGKLTVEEGESVTLKITPADSYEIDTITVNEGAYTATDGTITLENIFEAKTVKVTFKEKVVTPAIAATGADYLIPGSYKQGEKTWPSVTAYYKMTLPENADLKEYGMYFGDGTDAVRLLAQGKTADHVFGIRVFGEAVEKGSTYTFKGFLQLNGEEEIPGTEGTYTIEE